jgi:hypothetical protein
MLPLPSSRGEVFDLFYAKGPRGGGSTQYTMQRKKTQKGDSYVKDHGIVEMRLKFLAAADKNSKITYTYYLKLRYRKADIAPPPRPQN